MTQKLNRYSSRITQPKSQGASQAMLHGTGLTDADMDKAQVGISSVWYEGNTCNMHLNDLAARVREGVVDAGLVGMRFNTIGVSDGISMGTDGMSFSLQSRDLIADSIETVMSAQWYDANISLPGCDKNMPGCLIAMGRLNRPSLMIYGGTIKPGHYHNQTFDIVSAFQSYGEFIAGKIDETTRHNIVDHACPGPGACGGMYTANTMASAIEAMGMSLPYSSSTPAVDPGKLAECYNAGQAVRHLLEQDIKPRDIMTRAAFENAMVIVMALGGSTNAVLHLIAMARAVDVDLGIDDFQSVSERIPFLADLKPSGRYVMGRSRDTPSRTTCRTCRDWQTGRTCCIHCPGRSRPAVTSRSSRATWRRAVRWRRSPARRVCTSAALRGSMTRRKTCWRHSRQARSARVMSW